MLFVKYILNKKFYIKFKLFCLIICNRIRSIFIFAYFNYRNKFAQFSLIFFSKNLSMALYKLFNIKFKFKNFKQFTKNEFVLNIKIQKNSLNFKLITHIHKMLAKSFTLLFYNQFSSIDNNKIITDKLIKNRIYYVTCNYCKKKFRNIEIIHSYINTDECVFKEYFLFTNFNCVFCNKSVNITIQVREKFRKNIYNLAKMIIIENFSLKSLKKMIFKFKLCCFEQFYIFIFPKYMILNDFNEMKNLFFSIYNFETFVISYNIFNKNLNRSIGFLDNRIYLKKFFNYKIIELNKIIFDLFSS
ncbi:hypothetical protein [Guillardia theta]|uniref:Uncharacterized protein n=1 Tax=Guillardia theta TaxID=55529 RepID=Q9AW76_GUITH|nr:hypothetical protein GTHECHR2137 [Guillardia theta]CAC26994.1 hypothetical protein [Guillardia theta]